MPLRMQNRQVITAATINASVLSPIMDVQGIMNFTFQSIWSGGGTPAGNFQIFVSNDPANLPNVGASTAITNGTQLGSDVAIAGNSGSNLLPDPNAAAKAAFQAYRFVQFKYNFTSGTATLNTYYFGQGIT